MRKLIQKAVLRPSREQREPTGALLITFRDGRPHMTGLIDEAAEAKIAAIMGAISEPEVANGDDDPIGPCAGQA